MFGSNGLRKSLRIHQGLSCSAILILLVPKVVYAESPLLSMELEKLMEMNVTTVTKRTQSYKDSAAAIHIITQEDIRRSGATVLPEVLDLAPGVNTGRINSFLWGVTARGLLSQYAEKLLVMVDGRSVYHPYLSGVFWESMLPSLNEIERIEVIRGPGASIWGANAVNGIINIITYDSELTQGQRVTAGAGNEEHGFVRYRTGLRQETVSGRINVDVRKVDDSFDKERNAGASDNYESKQISSRIDWKPQISDLVSVDLGYTTTNLQGIFYVDPAIEAVTPPNFASPKNIYGSDSGWMMSTWLHALDSQDSIQLRAYVDWEDRIEQAYDYKRTTTDMDFQYNFIERADHRVTWGVGGRHVQDKTAGSFIIDFSDSTLEYNKYTAFVQDEYQISDAFIGTIGVKYERNDFTDSQYQPSLRLAYHIDDDALVWSSLSRAVRTPATATHVWDWKFSATPELKSFAESISPGASDRVFIEAVGNFEYESEIAKTFEIGYRTFIKDAVVIDAALYFSRLDDLRSLTLEGIRTYPSHIEPTATYTAFLVGIGNDAKGTTKGVELLVKAEISEFWELQSGYTYTTLSSKDKLSTGTDYYASLAYITPEHTLYMVSRHNLLDGWEIDLKFKYVDKRYDQQVFGYELPAYHDFSVRIARNLLPNLEIALVGKQLLDPARSEIYGTFLGPIATETERSCFFQIDWK